MNVLDRLFSLVWGVPLLALILFTGLLYTVRLRGIQFRRLGEGFRLLFKGGEGKGDVSRFQSLCTILSAALGTGNIVGIATALTLGGPGAMFWMVVAAVLGMATNYAEATLAVKYRRISRDGEVLGGPFLYIEDGMGRRFRPLAKLFAALCCCSGVLGIGTMVQMNSIMGAVRAVSPDAKAAFWGLSYAELTVAAVVVLIVAVVLVGNAQRLGRWTEVLVPFMSVFYLGSALIIVCLNIGQIPQALALILQEAFSTGGVAGGAAGAGMMMAIRVGIARGVFTNEAGLGSTPIAAAAARTKHPAEQGLVVMTAPFIDTVVMCVLTALVLIVTGVYTGGGEGVEMTVQGFMQGLTFAPQLGRYTVVLGLFLFPLASILGWSYYGSKCAEYLFGRRAVKGYKTLYATTVFVGAFLSLEMVWKVADIFNGLMAIPNLIALLCLVGVVVRETQDYEGRRLGAPGPKQKRGCAGREKRLLWRRG